MENKYSHITLKKGEGRLIKSGGLNVFDNEIADFPEGIIDGDIVEIHDFDGFYLGTGFINRRSKITVRLLARRNRVDDIGALIKLRVKNAWEYRKTTVDTANCRLIFSEADFLPGIVVDKFGDHLVVESNALGIDRLKMRILDELKAVLGADGINIRGIYARSDAKLCSLEGMEAVNGFIGPEFDTDIKITENGVNYIVDIKDGQKTGFFLDQKYNRLAVQKLCAGASVLDCFTHTGSFALNAVKGGAKEVLAADISATAIEQARKNAALNGYEDKVEFICTDVFELLPDLIGRGRSFDVVILDPPAFTKSRASVKNAAKGYKEINLRGMKLVRNNGYLCTCSCSRFMEPDAFYEVIRSAAKDAHKRIRQIEYRTQSPDHPILWDAGDTYYLKFYILQVCDEI
ncbi:MAG: class I SAM-dependent rRNA methyltransferase [Lachnospiraceae bacterium]|nr:class I SAM-dependent rRNA methyltransferase [Lachnospiraceae bacterium]